jgi:hypothetical protein
LERKSTESPCKQQGRFLAIRFIFFTQSALSLDNKPPPMEVHAHAHTPRQKWTHYFWEFFMLFLAVFCGYLAEWILEHNIETQRENKFMHSLLRDLKVDQQQLSEFTNRRELKNRQCDSLINQLTTLPREDQGDSYYWGRLATRRNHFYPQDIALQQLKSSGGFRVIDSQEVLDEINAYELLLKANKENIELEEKELSEYSEIAGKVYNVSVFQQMTKQDTILLRPMADAALMTYDPSVLNELCIRLHYWKRTSLSTINNFRAIAAQGEKLTGLIQTKYHLSKD